MKYPLMHHPLLRAPRPGDNEVRHGFAENKQERRRMG